MPSVPRGRSRRRPGRRGGSTAACDSPVPGAPRAPGRACRAARAVAWAAAYGYRPTPPDADDPSVRRTVSVSLAVLLAALLVVRVGVRSEAVAPGSRGDIAFASNRSGTYDIYAMAPGSGTVTPLIQTSAQERAPAWNP